ncbi:MAG: hypothetical protein ABII90_02265 [Bacteroidota bacterium]
MVFLNLLIPTNHTIAKPRPQDVSVSATIDTNDILIGDHVHLNLKAKYPTGDIINWPLITDTITGQIEVVERTQFDTVLTQDKKNTILSQSLIITSFDSGFFVIPPFQFSVKRDTANITETEPLLLTVHTVQVDTALAIKDIKSPLEIPLTIEEILPYILAVVGVISLILIIIYLYKKHKKKPERIIFKKPKEPPHLIALRKLKELEDSKLWQQNKIKPYYSDLTEIVRTYIEHRFNIIAMELTTGETLSCFQNVDIEPDLKSKLKQMLSLADMVKFAKAKPIASEHELSLKIAYDFIKGTIPEGRSEGRLPAEDSAKAGEVRDERQLVPPITIKSESEKQDTTGPMSLS